jgi:hypothetical protein
VIEHVLSVVDKDDHLPRLVHDTVSLPPSAIGPLSNWQVGAKTAKTSDISCVETQIFEHGLFLDVTQELGLLEVIAPVIKVCSIEWSLGTCIGSMGRTLLPSGFFD